ncbi:MAG: outer membrane protein transport protein [Smithellaceae bacterium]|nr:outer membrane protein transport protein [Smithellaceae bacterium]
MKRNLRRFLLLSLLMLGVAAPAFGSGISDSHGVSARAIAMGGAFTAVADNYAAAFYNPAGLAQKTGNEIAIEYLYISPRMSVKTLNGQDLKTYTAVGVGGGGDLRDDPTQASFHGLDVPAPFIGLILDINKIVPMPVNTRFGLALSFPENFNVCYAINSFAPDQPHFIRYGDESNRVTLAAGVGVEVVEHLLYLGGGLQAMTHGKGIAYPRQAANSAGQDVAKTYQESIFRADPLAGVLVTPFGGKVKIGFSWRDEEYFDIAMATSATQGFQGIINQTLGVQLPTIIPGGLDINMGMNILCFYTPEEYSLGVAFDLGKCLVSLEANQQLWSKYDFTPAQRVYYTGNMDFSDTINYRAGIEYRISRSASLLAGYYYQPTPVPDQSGRKTNFLDMDKNVFSIGFTKTFRDPFHFIKDGRVNLTGAFQYQLLDDYTVYKNNVSGPTWTTQQSYTVDGDCYAGMIGANVRW